MTTRPRPRLSIEIARYYAEPDLNLRALFAWAGIKSANYTDYNLTRLPRYYGNKTANEIYNLLGHLSD